MPTPGPVSCAPALRGSAQVSGSNPNPPTPLGHCAIHAKPDSEHTEAVLLVFPVGWLARRPQQNHLVFENPEPVPGSLPAQHRVASGEGRAACALGSANPRSMSDTCTKEQGNEGETRQLAGRPARAPSEVRVQPRGPHSQLASPTPENHWHHQATPAVPPAAWRARCWPPEPQAKETSASLWGGDEGASVRRPAWAGAGGGHCS